jgi:hypothetical protein
VARVMMQGGIYMGAKRNVQEDALEFTDFEYNWTPPFLAAQRMGGQLEGKDRERMNADFATACSRHRTPMEDPAAPWGWKHSPSVHLLPFLSDLYQELRFIHVMRDVRDFAFRPGGAHAHTVRLGPAVLDGDPTPASGWRGVYTDIPTPLRKAQFWARVHADCADFAEERLGSRYLRVRLEDLCSKPEQLLRDMFDFAEVDTVDPDGIRAEIVTPASIGSWRTRDPAELAPLLEAAGPALERFGYVD